MSEWSRLTARERASRWRASQFKCEVEKVNLVEVLERDGMTCYICDKLIESMADLEFDHVISLAKGGSHSSENIKPSHARCNWQKH
jgi:5-methylcytosine-specific restriction endonuclease McrA